MFLLTVGASVLCDSYDPDPWDDTPPVVTVEFEFLKPQVITIQDTQHKTGDVISVADVHIACAFSEPALFAACSATPDELRPGIPVFSPLRT